MLLLPHVPQTVEAHGEKWVTLHLVTSDEKCTYYLAARASQAFPSEVLLIQVSREWEREQREKAIAEFRKQQDSPPAAEADVEE